VSADATQAGTVSIAGAGGDVIDAYLARPLHEDSVGGVVVIHHMPGYDAATKEITRRFAVMGYNAICPNLHHRDAPGAAPDDAAAASRAAGGVPDERLVGDVGGAAEHLRALDNANGRVGVIGYCSGGRQALLAACSLQLDAAVDCYGAFAVRRPPSDTPLRLTPLTDLLPNLSCPLLGLFGANDRNPPPDEVAELDGLLTDAGKTHEFHVFDGAGHGFFAVDRPSYVQEAASRGWELVTNFFARHLSTH
jgi:carboxymethylenebutenolidase